MAALPGYVAPTVRQTYTIEAMHPLYGGFSVHVPFREPLPGEPKPPAYDPTTFPRFAGIMPHEPNTILLRVATEIVPSIITVEEAQGGLIGHAIDGGEVMFGGEIMVSLEGPVVVEAVTASVVQTPITLRVGRYQVWVEVADRTEAIRLYEAWSEEHPYVNEAPEGYWETDCLATEHWWITFSRVKGVV
jgi:hypothetical protein